MLASVAYVLASFVRTAPIRFRSLELPAPPPRIAVAQTTRVGRRLGACRSRCLRAAPAERTRLHAISRRVPGCAASRARESRARRRRRLRRVDGAVAETLHAIGKLLPALIVYRVVYYLLPLAVALLMLVADELRQRREQAARVRALMGSMAEQLMPRVLSRLHVSRRRRAVVLRRHTCGCRAAGVARPRCFRSASSKRRISPAASSAPRSCCCRKDCPAGSTRRIS